MHLNPREIFTVVRQIEDHTDNSTYYVRAVIRNAKTDALITTINLTDQGSRRFSGPFKVPADVSGQGFWVSILTSIYTDAGYTTKSPNYGDKMDTYLVQDRLPFNPNYPVPVGGGSDIDYKRIRKIVEEVVDGLDIPKPKDVVIPKVDIAGPLEAHSARIIAAIDAKKIPASVDHTKAIKDLRDVVSAHTKTMSGSNDALSEVIFARFRALEKEIQGYEAKGLSLPKDIIKKLGEHAESISKEIKNIKLNVPEMKLSVAPNASIEPKKPDVAPRVKSLMK